MEVLIKNLITLAMLAVLCVGSAFYGMVNWHCNLVPEVPIIRPDTPQAGVELAQQRYHDVIEKRKQEAQIPFAASVAMTFIGFSGAIVCIVGAIILCSPELIGGSSGDNGGRRV